MRKRRLGLAGVGEVAGEHLAALISSSPRWPGSTGAPLSTSTTRASVAGDKAAHGSRRLLPTRRVQPGQGELGHPPPLFDLDAGELGELGLGFRVERRRSTTHTFDGGEGVARRAGVLGELRQRRRDAVEQVDLCSCTALQSESGVKGRKRNSWPRMRSIKCSCPMRP